MSLLLSRLRPAPTSPFMSVMTSQFASFYPLQFPRRKESSLIPTSVENNHVALDSPLNQPIENGLKSNHVATGFERMKLRDDVMKALGALGLEKPTHIQELAIPQILKGHTCLLAAETGSGKTLSYITPILNQIKNEEDSGLIRRKSFPRALILTPTRELVTQVLKVVKSLSHHVKLRSVGLVGGTKKNLEREKLDATVDIVVSTPGRFIAHKKDDAVFLGDIRFLVLDEADTLFKEDFVDEIKQIVNPIQKRPDVGDYPRQFITASATLPKDITKAIDKMFPDVKHITTPLLHRTPPKIKQRFVPIRSQQGSKQNHLVQFLRATDSKKIIIFCNTIKACEALYSFLKGENYPVLYFHKRQSFEERKSHYENFIGGEKMLLVTTDIGSRGLDTTMVDHVVMFDFPKNGIDYLHRAGRTGRLGTTGQVTCFVGRKDRRLAATIERTIRMRKPLGWRPTEKILGRTVEDLVSGNKDKKGAKSSYGGGKKTYGGKPSHEAKSSYAGKSSRGGYKNYGVVSDQKGRGQGMRKRESSRD